MNLFYGAYVDLPKLEHLVQSLIDTSESAAQQTVLRHPLRVLRMRDWRRRIDDVDDQLCEYADDGYDIDGADDAPDTPEYAAIDALIEERRQLQQLVDVYAATAVSCDDVHVDSALDAVAAFLKHDALELLRIAADIFLVGARPERPAFAGGSASVAALCPLAAIRALHCIRCDRKCESYVCDMMCETYVLADGR